ncbi:hypothetical protein HY468_04105, partial [Candidatus Roizmanbacteria bacterium]|nr:hypothetical protein [Candidatus Roizmanbacteria bacterium]
ADKILEKNLQQYNVLPGTYKSQFNSFASLGSIAAGTVAFDAEASYGIPIEDSKEIIESKHWVTNYNQEEFDLSAKKTKELHKNLSREKSAKKFKGGLADRSDEVVKLHTATHLLHQSLRTVLGKHVQQKGSNITGERLRFDFSHPEKMTPEQIKNVEEMVNEQIKKELPVTKEITTYDEAIRQGALAFFGERYPEKVSFYSIGSFSKEICGGPHVANTKELGNFKIRKEESAGAGIRRIYAILV